MGSKFGDYEPDYNSWHDGIRYADGEYQVWIDGSLIGYGKTYAQALGIQSNANLARATHRHITFDDLKAMKAAGNFGEYVRSLDAEGMASVAHMLVSANHAAGNLVEYSAVFSRLVELRNVAREVVLPLSDIVKDRPIAQILVVAEYETEHEQIVIRRGYRGQLLHFCDTWTQAQEYMQSIGAR